METFVQTVSPARGSTGNPQRQASQYRPLNRRKRASRDNRLCRGLSPMKPAGTRRNRGPATPLARRSIRRDIPRFDILSGAMPVAALTTLGCKVNQYETERIAEDFANAGFTLTDFDSPADVYVINSCSVTAAADRKSRHLARKAARTNPDALVVMTGCHSQQVIDDNGAVEGAGLLVPNHEKMQVFAKTLAHRPDLLMLSSSPATLPRVPTAHGRR